ncbi:MAG: type II toxin-antitoxin system RelE/ParE family toxin [Campylobacteraceae bacterium]|jgi:mRNA interferase RelE/StbE|nr:type II toxin-antitoxin system RelE/ParE family toxin [Campylobacteraceae bacterium]
MLVEVSETAKKQFKKLDNSIQKAIQKQIKEIEALPNPRMRGKALLSNLRDLWRYRVGDYRLICEIQDNKLIILVLEIGQERYL